MAFPPPSDPYASLWNLDPDVIFLNHGSFGARPTPILDRQFPVSRRMARMDGEEKKLG